MPFQSKNGLRYFQFVNFGDQVRHGIFTRQGGLSPEPWSSLNMGGTVGDDPDRVIKNRQNAIKVLGLTLESIYDVWQVHGVHLAIAQSPHPMGMPHLQADAILTNKPGITLMMRFADCVPILLHDPIQKVIGIAHAGWLGTVNHIARIAVEAMQTNFGSIPANILAAIGPSIGPDHYEVGQEVVMHVRRAFGKRTPDLVSTHIHAVHFDLWAANRLMLELAGVQQIELAGLCTACHIDDWFSHRAEQGRTGRFGAFIGLRS